MFLIVMHHADFTEQEGLFGRSAQHSLDLGRMIRDQADKAVGGEIQQDCLNNQDNGCRHDAAVQPGAEKDKQTGLYDDRDRQQAAQFVQFLTHLQFLPGPGGAGLS